jgi:hypothetical protein
MLRKNSKFVRILAIAAAIGPGLAASVSGSRAACNGCAPGAETTTDYCTASCSTEGFSLSIVHVTPGANGAMLPPTGCTQTSADGSYMILEGVPKIRNYSATHAGQYPGGWNPIKTTVIHQSQNDFYCEADSSQSQIFGTVYSVEFQNTQGFRACIPVSATTECTGINAMAATFMTKLRSYNQTVSLPTCYGECAGMAAGGSGGSSLQGTGASKFHPASESGLETDELRKHGGGTLKPGDGVTRPGGSVAAAAAGGGKLADKVAPGSPAGAAAPAEKQKR